MWGTPLERSGRRRSDGGAADSSKYFSALLSNIMSMYAGSITMPGGRWEFNTRMISSKPGAPISLHGLERKLHQPLLCLFSEGEIAQTSKSMI